MDNQQERIGWVYWLAGLIEGEGCITLLWCHTRKGPRRMIRPAVKLAMIDLRIIEKAHQICNENGVGGFIYHKKLHRSHHQPVHELNVDGCKRVKALLTLIHPFLIGKKAEAEVVMEFINHRLSLPPKSAYTDYDRGFKERCSSLKPQNRPIIPNDYTPAVGVHPAMI